MENFFQHHSTVVEKFHGCTGYFSVHDGMGRLHMAVGHHEFAEDVRTGARLDEVSWSVL